jgi:hypothetical protein
MFSFARALRRSARALLFGLCVADWFKLRGGCWGLRLHTASASIASNSDLVGLSPMEDLSLETNDALAATVLARKHSDYACRLALMALAGGHLALLTAPIKKRSHNE